MQELINRLTEKAGISADQATKSVDTIKDFVKEKFPMMAGAVDNLFAPAAASSTETAQAALSTLPGDAKESADSIGDKVEDFAKKAADKAENLYDSAKEKINQAMDSDTGKKVEAFAKNAADKAEDLFDSAKEKLSSFFGGKDEKSEEKKV